MVDGVRLRLYQLVLSLPTSLLLPFVIIRTDVKVGSLTNRQSNFSGMEIS